jgi:hypothetical protein
LLFEFDFLEVLFHNIWRFYDLKTGKILVCKSSDQKGFVGQHDIREKQSSPLHFWYAGNWSFFCNCPVDTASVITWCFLKLNFLAFFFMVTVVFLRFRDKNYFLIPVNGEQTLGRFNLAIPGVAAWNFT